MTYIGIDPGKNGGIAVITDDGLVSACKMPDTEQEILATLSAATGAGSATYAVLERVHAGVFGGGKSGRMGVSSAFSFGRGYGGLRMALVASGVPFDEPLPAQWQKVMSCRTGGDKNVTKRRAQELFPSMKHITHAVADALLLAEYCRRQHQRPS